MELAELSQAKRTMFSLIANGNAEMGEVDGATGGFLFSVDNVVTTTTIDGSHRQIVLASKRFVTKYKCRHSSVHMWVSGDELIVIRKQALYDRMIPLQLILHE